MARKTLLNEGEIRKFMKLANLGPLSENFLDEVEDEEMEVEDEVAPRLLINLGRRPQGPPRLVDLVEALAPLRAR